VASALTWLDYSDSDRRQAIEVLSAFRDRESRDELGLGSIRDSFAEQLFPGTSTIQTRARYFLFVPWIYRLVEEGVGGRGGSSAKRARKLEAELIAVLVASGDADGTIGRRAGTDLQRLPSAIYWSGLRTLGLRQFSGSREAYHRWLDQGGSSRRERMVEDGDPEATDERSASAWLRLPPPPEGFPSGVSLRLTSADASFLQERVRSAVPGTFLEHLLTKDGLIQTEYPWDHADDPTLSPQIAEQLRHAEVFSLVMHGAALLYNLLLAEHSDNDERVATYRGRLGTWVAECGELDRRLAAWDLQRFWEIVHAGPSHVSSRTVEFCESWVGFLNSPGTVANDLAARALVSERERRLKRARARLQNPRALKNWSGASGTERLTFRWGISRILVDDILKGLIDA